MKPSVFVKSAVALGMTAGFSATAGASCGNNLYCGSSGSTTMQPLSSYNTSYNNSAAQYVPFTSTQSTSGNISIPGLGATESLTPTSCPVDVNGLQSGQSVLGCYQVMRQTPQPTVRYHLGAPNTTRVVRPIVYVRYPVPTPVYGIRYPVPTPRPMPMPYGYGAGFGFHPGMMPAFRPGMCGAPVLPHPMYFGRCGW